MSHPRDKTLYRYDYEAICLVLLTTGTGLPQKKKKKHTWISRSWTTLSPDSVYQSRNPRNGIFYYQAEIIVGTAASNLNLNQNPCAKALSNAAGPCLQQECMKIGHVAIGDIAVNNQPGNLNCKAVIFAICSEWDSGNGRKVKRYLLLKRMVLL